MLFVSFWCLLFRISVMCYHINCQASEWGFFSGKETQVTRLLYNVLHWIFILFYFCFRAQDKYIMLWVSTTVISPSLSLDLTKSYLSKSGLLLLIMMFNYVTLVFFRCGPENWFSFSRVSVEFQPSFVVVVSYDYPHVFSSCVILNEGLSRRSFLVWRKLITAFMPFYYFLVLHQIWLNILTDGIIVGVDNCNWIQSIKHF